jgi:hypothetical protein
LRHIGADVDLRRLKIMIMAERTRDSMLVTMNERRTC